MRTKKNPLEAGRRYADEEVRQRRLRFRADGAGASLVQFFTAADKVWQAKGDPVFSPLIVRGRPLDPQTQVGWFGSVSQGSKQQCHGVEELTGYPSRPRSLLGLRGTVPIPGLLQLSELRRFDPCCPDEESVPNGAIEGVSALKTKDR